MMINVKIEADKKRETRPLSPCTLICTLDDERRCLGCGRTLEQISQWSLLSAIQQWTIVDELAIRAKANNGTIDPGLRINQRFPGRD